MIFYIVIPLVLALYGGLNYYIGLRGWQWVSALAPGFGWRPVYWVVFWLLAMAFPLGRLASGWLPVAVSDLIAKVGGYFMATYVYIFPLLLVIDLVRLVHRWGWIPARLVPDVNLVKVTGTVLCLLYVGLMVYGTWRARTPVVVTYDVAVPKSAGALEQLNVVLISDTHLGSIIGNSRIRQMVDVVNGLEPDLVLVAGDITDDDFRPVVAHDMPAELSKMKSRLGTYGILGNHDSGAANLSEFRAQMERAGIHLLVDEWVKVDDSFYVVGRNDPSKRRLSGGESLPLRSVLVGVDTSLPVLLMDHQPNRLEEAAAAGVDLQVSGHTHRGQVFPGNLITNKVFEVDWGYLQKQATHYVVSLGYGTWGPPVRIGNAPEVVQIRLSFGE